MVGIMLVFMIGCSSVKQEPVVYEGRWEFISAPPYSWLLYHTKTGEIIQGVIDGTKEFILYNQKITSQKQLF